MDIELGQRASESAHFISTYSNPECSVHSDIILDLGAPSSAEIMPRLDRSVASWSNRIIQTSPIDRYGYHMGSERDEAELYGRGVPADKLA